MNKGDFVNALQERAELESNAQAQRVADAVFGLISDTLAQGEDVNITGFGKFHVRRRSARKGVNPQTGEEMEIPATTVPKFKAGKSLKDAVK